MRTAAFRPDKDRRIRKWYLRLPLTVSLVGVCLMGIIGPLSADRVVLTDVPLFPLKAPPPPVELAVRTEGVANTVSGVPEYIWWYGCAPTAGGMIIGWWDSQAGTQNLFDGDATSWYGDLTSGTKRMVASKAHHDAGQALGLEYGSWQNHDPNCIADFFKTENGSTSDLDATQGYKDFCAWDNPATTVDESYLADAARHLTSEGWTYEDYCAQIDDGRPVHLLLTSDDGGHAVTGIGYDNTDGKREYIAWTTWGHYPQVSWGWNGEDESGHNFQVGGGICLQIVPRGQTPAVQVTSPNSQDEWLEGTTHQILWLADDDGVIDHVDLYYSLDGGNSWNSIATGENNDGTYDWTIPPVSADRTNCLVRVIAEDNDGNSGQGESEQFTIDDPQVVQFPDADLEAAVRQGLEKPAGDIYAYEVRKLSGFTATGWGISDLTGLEEFTALTQLTLDNNNIDDLSPISGLTGLTELSLAANNISDLSALSGLTALTDVNVADNRISDIGPLVANSGIDDGTADLTDNELDMSEGAPATRSVAALEGRGVTVLCDNQTPRRLYDALTRVLTACYAPTNYDPTAGVEPSHDSIASDLSALYDLGFRGIVTYGSDGVLADIPGIARNQGFQVIIEGVWNPTNQAKLDVAAANAADVTAYCIGNEGLQRGDYTLQQVHDAMVWMRQQTDRPVVTAERWEQYVNNADLVEQCGPLVFANCHPVWAGHQDPEAGASWTVDRYQELSDAIASKLAWLKETGWATDGPSWCTETNQRDYFSALLEAGDDVRFCWFEAYDQSWKHEMLDGHDIGPHWGLFTADRAPKTATGLLGDIHLVLITDGPSGTPNPVGSQGEVNLSVSAEDTKGHALEYQWSAEGGAGNFDDAMGPEATWTAPSNSSDTVDEYTITVTVNCAQAPDVNTSGSYKQKVVRQIHGDFDGNGRIDEGDLVRFIQEGWIPAHQPEGTVNDRYDIWPRDGDDRIDGNDAAEFLEVLLQEGAQGL